MDSVEVSDQKTGFKFRSMVMFAAEIENVESDRIARYVLRRDGELIPYVGVLELWRSNAEFCTFFNQLLADSPFSAYRWETPAVTKATAGQAFQFVLLNCPGFCSRKTDFKTYKSYFTDDATDEGIVSFPSLGGDANLVIPSPRTNTDAYGHLAAFVRQAPKKQRAALWSVVSSSVKSRIGDRPLWLSTAGGGVAWLHVRLDSRPKYYGYAPYKSATPIAI